MKIHMSKNQKNENKMENWFVILSKKKKQKKTGS